MQRPPVRSANIRLPSRRGRLAVCYRRVWLANRVDHIVAWREITGLVNCTGLNHSRKPGEIAYAASSGLRIGRVGIEFGIAGAGVIAKAAFSPACLVDETP